MGLYIQNELNFDRFHKNASSIYRVAFSDYLNEGGYATTPIPIGGAMLDQLPEVKAMTHLATGDPYLFKYGTNQGFEKLTFADASIFNIFSFPLVEGDANTALKDPFTIVISEKLAKKYFGNESPLNKLLKIGSTGSISSVVKGVFKTIPQNSHLQFDCLVSFATWNKLEYPSTLWRQMPGNYTYILLNENADIKKLEQKLPQFVSKNVGEELKQQKNPSYKLMLQPLLPIHLNSHLQGEAPGGGNMTYVFLLGAIALIILLIACINFINFSTANAMQRMREIGVRKIIGAGKMQLAGQFLAESVFTFFIAALVALVLAQILLPVFNSTADRSFVIYDFINPGVMTALVLTGCLTGIAAGIFPAWSVSRITSIDALKGKISGLGKRSSLSRVLVTTQFVASIVLIISATVVYQQMQYVRNLAASKEGDQVVVFRMNGKVVKKLDVLKAQLLSSPAIKDFAASTNVPGFTNDGWPIRLTENSTPIQAQNYVADDRYLETMDLQLIAGRKLSSENTSDIKEGFIINETASKALGFATPQQAIDQQLLWGGDEKKRGKIAGVVKDFHINTLHEKISPAVIQFAPYPWMTYQYALIKLPPTHIANSIAFIKKAVATIDPDWLVDY
jgi:putative ABC transport system permease protein